MKYSVITSLSLNSDVILVSTQVVVTLLRNKTISKFRITVAQIKSILLMGLETKESHIYASVFFAFLERRLQG